MKTVLFYVGACLCMHLFCMLQSVLEWRLENQYIECRRRDI